MIEHDKIRANAELVIQSLGPISDLGERFGYNRESIAWVEGFIERQRSRPDIKPEEIERLISVIGSFLGECIIRHYGGEWREDDGSIGVFFDASNGAYPFNKVRKQFDNGLKGGDSISSFFDAIEPVIIKRGWEKPPEQQSGGRPIDHRQSNHRILRRLLVAALIFFIFMFVLVVGSALPGIVRMWQGRATGIGIVPGASPAENHVRIIVLLLVAVFAYWTAGRWARPK